MKLMVYVAGFRVSNTSSPGLPEASGSEGPWFRGMVKCLWSRVGGLYGFRFNGWREYLVPVRVKSLGIRVDGRGLRVSDFGLRV